MTEKYIRTELANTNKTCYHTDSNCEQLGDYRTVTDNEIAYHELQLCEYCDPDANPRHNEEVDRSYLNALLEAAKNE